MLGCPTEEPICPDGFVLVEDGTCVGPCGLPECDQPCGGLQCLAGTVLDAELCTCGPAPCDCSGVPLPPRAIGIRAHHDPIGGGGFQCLCVPSGCIEGYELVGVECMRICPAFECRSGPEECVPCDFDGCCVDPQNPHCIPGLCSDCPIAVDGTDLRAAGKCVEPPARNTCVECHRLIEEPHPWFGGPGLTCAGCHGGDPEQIQRELAHVPLPREWQVGSPTLGRPNLRYYYNYLTLAGVERFDGGLEWLRFRDPGDLRIADRTCGKSGCHEEKVENVRRSLMATAAGLIDGARAAAGLPRAVVRGNSGIYKLDATLGITGGRAELRAVVHDPTAVGSVERIAAFAPRDRAARTYGEVDLLEEVYDKACGGCHLYGAGRNDRVGSFRGSGCSACHMAYAANGVSMSSDERIRKDEPTLPAAYHSIARFDPQDLLNLSGRWEGPERPHPIRHVLVTNINSQRCGVCHSGSNHTDWQFRGHQIDPNRTATRTLSLFEVQLTDEILPFLGARFRGYGRDQVLKFVDWDGDGRDDIPADVHYVALMECVDCHTSGEMHNEILRAKVEQVTDWTDPEQVQDLSGALWSRQDQATEVRCRHCHGTLDARALPFAADNRNPIRRLTACPEAGETIPGYEAPTWCTTAGAGRYLLTSTGRVLHVPQLFEASVEGAIFHGRPCIDGDPGRCFKNQATESGAVTAGFTHADRLDCTACHAAWTNRCFGCHVTVDDRVRDFSPSTGEHTLGKITQAEVTFVAPHDLQLGIDSGGEVAPFVSAGGLRLRHIQEDGGDWFGRRAIVAGDPSIRYGVYRHRTGYGLRPYDQESAGLLPNLDGPLFEQRPEMNANAAFSFNPITPHTTQRSHPRMDCTACHLDPGGSNAAEVAARFGVRPQGFGGLSAYLSRLDGLEIVRAKSGQRAKVDAALGYRLDGTLDPEARTVAGQLDWVASGTGFPYAATNHPLRVTLDERHRREFPTIAPMAGPPGPNLLLWMSDIVVLPRGVN